jgi:hypothetical protein
MFTTNFSQWYVCLTQCMGLLYNAANNRKRLGVFCGRQKSLFCFKCRKCDRALIRGQAGVWVGEEENVI